VFASVRPDPRTKFEHEDGICLLHPEYASGLRAMGCDDVWLVRREKDPLPISGSNTESRDIGDGSRDDRLAQLSRTNSQYARLHDTTSVSGINPG
jgi:hypothetical protein